MSKKNNKEELTELNREIPQPIPFLDGIEQIKHTLKFLTQTGDVKYGIEILDDSLDFITPGTVTLISATPNCLDLNTSVLTTKGFKNVKDLTYDDKVLNSNGEICNIISFTDTDEVDCYEIETTDGRKIISSYNHKHPIYYYSVISQKNNVKTRGYKEEYWTSEKIYKESQKKYRKNKIFIREFNDITTPDKELPVDPYILGVLLGDGCLTCGGLRYCKPSQEVFEKVKFRLPQAEVRFSPNKKDVIINDGGLIKKYIKSVGLGVHSYDKFIPDEYKINLSKQQKLDLLQGLLDTDGYQSSSYNEFSTTSKQLANDVQQLAWSLGYRCTIKNRMGKYKKNGVVKETRLNYRVTISNKRTKAQCVVKNVTKVSHRKTRCITIDNPNHTIVTDNYLVTSNTGKSLIAQIICNNIAKQGQKVMYCSCEMSAGQLMLREFVRTMGVTKRQLVEGYKTHPNSIVQILDIMEDKDDFDYLKNIMVQDIGSIHIDDLIKIYDDYDDFKYIIVDYVQNLKGDGADERNQFIDISKKLHNYAIRTGKSIIECAQIPKMTETEARTGKGIDFHKLRPMGSNQWEQDCDVLIKMAEDLEENQRYILINLYKNRLGGKKMITYKYIIDSRLNFVLQSRGV